MDHRTILLTTSTFPRDPADPVAAKFVLDLAIHLARSYRVIVLAPDAPGIPRRTEWEGVTVLRYTYFLPRSLQRLTRGEGTLANLRGSLLAKLQLPFLVLSQAVHLPWIVRRHRVDLVNSHWMVPQGWTFGIWRWLLRKPHVVTCHSADVFLLRRMPLGRMLARWIVRRTELFLPVSSYLGLLLGELNGAPVQQRVIPMGVDPARFRPDADPGPVRARHAPSGEKLVLFVGKLVPKKGVEVLLAAMSELRGRAGEVRLLIVGGGPLETLLRARIAELGLERVVHLAGWIRNEELPGYYAAADVVCVPSIVDEHGETEGMPVVVQEALAAGRVLVASSVSGIPDVVQDGVSGMLVPEKEPSLLAETLVRALELAPETRKAMQDHAVRAALEHSWDRVAARYSEAFEQVLEGPATVDPGRSGNPSSGTAKAVLGIRSSN